LTGADGALKLITSDYYQQSSIHRWFYRNPSTTFRITNRHDIQHVQDNIVLLPRLHSWSSSTWPTDRFHSVTLPC